MIMEDFKKYAQQEDGWCGPASLSYALAKQGREVSQRTLARVSQVDEEGMDTRPMEKMAKDYGMKTLVTEGKDAKETLDLLDFYLRNGWSVILDYCAGDDIDEDGHYVVLEKVGKDKLEVFDPGNGGNLKQLDKDYFISHWQDTHDDGKKFKHFALIFHA